MRKKSVIIIILFILDMLLLVVVLPSKQNQLNKMISDYTELRNKIKQEGLMGYEYMYKKKEEVGEFEKKLRTTKDFPKLISHLFEQSYLSKVDLMNISYTFEEKKDIKLQKVILNITVDGTYEGIRRYIYSLERGSYFFEVSGIKINRKVPLISANIFVNTYLKEEI